MRIRIDVYHHHCADDSDQTSLADVLAAVTRLEKITMTQTESINKLNAAFEAFKAQQASAIANIQADEAAILAKLNTLGELTPENQAVVDSVITGLTKLGTDLQAVADSIPEPA